MNEKKSLHKQTGHAHVNSLLLGSVEAEIQSFIKQKHPEYTKDTLLTFSELLDYRLDYMKSMISTDSEKMESLNTSIVQTIKNNETISNNLNQTVEKNLTLGQRAADSIAKFGGSWPFIFLFIGILFGWILLNVTGLFFHPFDAYPFILLNLALSCLAAIQAPIIMMSQNRQEERDRKQATNDYKVNLKAEIEINLLHEKMDYLLNTQWQHLVEMQHIQIELLGELQEQLNHPEAK